MESGIIMELYNYGIIELYWAQVGPLLQQHEEHDTPGYNRSDFKQGFIFMNPIESDNEMLDGRKQGLPSSGLTNINFQKVMQ